MTTLGRYAEALRHFDEALAIDPTHEAALSYRGYVLERMGNVAEAHASDLHAAETLPDSAQIRSVGTTNNDDSYDDSNICFLFFWLLSFFPFVATPQSAILRTRTHAAF